MDSDGEAGVVAAAAVEFSFPPPLNLRPLSPSSSGVPTPATAFSGPHPLVCTNTQRLGYTIGVISVS